MSAPGGHFQVPALQAALASLKLGTIGRKDHLAERFCNAVHEDDVGDAISQGAGGTAAVVDTEADIARCSKVREFEVRATAAWQEHISDDAAGHQAVTVSSLFGLSAGLCRHAVTKKERVIS